MSRPDAREVGFSRPSRDRDVDAARPREYVPLTSRDRVRAPVRFPVKAGVSRPIVKGKRRVIRARGGRPRQGLLLKGKTRPAGGKTRKILTKSPRVREISVDPVADRCAPILDVIRRANALPPEVLGMVSAMLPHGLRTASNERHEYQTQMIDKIGEVLSTVEEDRRKSLKIAEQRMASLPEEKAIATAALNAAEQRAAVAHEARDTKKAEVKKADRCVAEAEEAVKVTTQKACGIESENAQWMEERAELEEILSEKLEPLKGGVWTGKDWRTRDRAIEAVVRFLEKLSAQESLRHGLQDALRRKIVDRHKFSQQCIEYSEELLRKHLANLGEKIANFESERQARDKAAEVAVDTLGEAKKRQEKCRAEFATARSLFNRASEARTMAEATLATLDGPNAMVGKSAVDFAKAELNEVRELLLHFHALRVGPPAYDSRAHEMQAQWSSAAQQAPLSQAPGPWHGDAQPHLAQAPGQWKGSTQPHPAQAPSQLKAGANPLHLQAAGQWKGGAQPPHMQAPGAPGHWKGGTQPLPGQAPGQRHSGVQPPLAQDPPLHSPLHVIRQDLHAARQEPPHAARHDLQQHSARQESQHASRHELLHPLRQEPLHMSRQDPPCHAPPHIVHQDPPLHAPLHILRQDPPCHAPQLTVRQDPRCSEPHPFVF